MCIGRVWGEELRIGQCNDGVVYDVSGTLLASSAQRW